MKLEIDLEPLLKLAPDPQARRDVSAVTVEDQDILESGVVHAADRVVQDAQPASRHRGERARVPHVMLADADVHRRRDDHARREPACDFDRNVQHASPIVLHGEMLEVLLGRRDRDDARLELARLHPLAEFAPRVLVQK